MTQRGFVIWLSGLSGAGKSTIATALARRLDDAALPVEVLDGDDVRRVLSSGLGFTREDRDTNVLRIGFVAQLLARNGVAVIVAAISPYAATREKVRAWFDEFIEVHVDCSLDELVRRDTKGLYRRALAGALEHFTGISDPYEAPAQPDVRVDTEHWTVDECVDAVAAVLQRRELLGGPAERPAPARALVADGIASGSTAR